ncbi:hypothetical protein [Deinococcus hopiensis]|uniref:Uncharacterized protein n=1 Tax=Deinococcus hopiensis KR-140 TaxID=695939 RepID=A0A1W1UWB8_9DEIO|nr:hypothetical protein [Deinococcus hopiensis]SMB85455.1 hypothetical protein SAMN00790413_03408 [Deinococcus hopiensis KR-140]
MTHQQAARHLGLPQVPVFWVNVDDQAAVRILIADNRTAEIESVARIRLAGSKGNLKADIWYLERSSPERWGKNRLEVTGKDGAPLEAHGAVVITPSNGRGDES